MTSSRDNDYLSYFLVPSGGAVISANKEGLLSLAKQLTALAEETPGSHIHYDENNSLEEGSAELIFVRKD